MAAIEWHDLAVALSLVLVIEGVLPFASPASWREMARQVATLGDHSLRTMGLISMVAGLGLLYWLN